MTKRYCIENIETGLYYLDGTWAEEPEWFDCAEAVAVARRLDVAIAIREHNFEEREYDLEMHVGGAAYYDAMGYNDGPDY